MDKVVDIQCSNLVFDLPVLEPVIGSYGPRVSLHVVFALDTAMHVWHRQWLCIGQRRGFNCCDAAATPLAVVLTGLVTFDERTAECDVARLRVLLCGDAQQRPPDVHRVAVERVVERGWIRWRIRVNLEAVTDRRHGTHPINEFAGAVTLFFANTVCDDVGLAGKLARVGFARSIPPTLVWLHVMLSQRGRVTRLS